MKSDKRLFGGFEHSPKSPKIAVFSDLSLFIPTCGFMKKRAEKAG